MVAIHRRERAMEVAMRTNRLVLGYAAFATVALVFLGGAVAGGARRATFDEIDVKRINVRENDGRLRMTISGADHAPGIIFRGKEQPHPDRKSAGVLFFNDEETENGGLIFGGKREGKNTQSYGHLSFDQYEQDQVLQLVQEEENGKRRAGMQINDRVDAPMDLSKLPQIRAMPDGPEKLAAAKEAGFGGAQRLFVGKTGDRASEVALKDAQGRTRLVLSVAEDGGASIRFLDETGKEIQRITPEAAK
jgi:hypothetical protein